MTTWNPQANEIFVRAIDVSGVEERQQFLISACGDDASLRQEISEMLERYFSETSLLRPDSSELDQTVIGSDETLDEMSVGTLRPGRQIGPYQLKETLGQGGMGTVFLAEQSVPVKREVALKLIRSGMDSSQVVARFETERQSLAMMDHPNIAKVLDAGTWEGLPYFVMELVRGEPLTQYCERKRLDIPQRLELFIHVGQAIQHAHQKGIIHRDLKPSNILVTEYDGQATVKVIDFGLAKALADKTTGEEKADGESLTMAGGVLGTPEYMSPEQASGKLASVDTRSDVYSLGVVLYELLSGTTPLTRQRVKSASFQEILKIIQEGDIPSPSSRLLQSTESLPAVSAARQIEVPSRLPGILKGDLDWIVMKALEKEASRRYQTVGLFCEDVENFLNDKPVSAGPISRRYRIRKFIRRYRVLVTATTGVLLAMLLGLIGTVWGLFRAYDAEQKAIDLQRAETLQRKQAETALAGERDALRERSLVLSDMYADRGWAAANEGDPSLAALWFCEAANVGSQDPDRVSANLLRSKNILTDAVNPVAAVKIGTLARMLDFSRDSELVAVHSSDGFAIIDWKQQMILPWTKRLSSTIGVTTHAWQPDSDSIWTAEKNRQVTLRDSSSGASLRAFSVPDVPSHVSVTQGGEIVAAAAGGSIHFWNVQEERHVYQALVLPGRIRWMNWSRNSSFLATIDEAQCLRVYAPAMQSEPLCTRENQSPLSVPAWSPLDAVLYSVEQDSNHSKIVELRITGNVANPTREFMLQLSRHTALSIQSDAAALIACGFKGIEHFNLLDPDPTATRVNHMNEVWHGDFIGSTQSWLASGRSMACIQTLIGEEQKSTDIPRVATVEVSAASREGRYIATVQGDGLLRVWEFNVSANFMESTENFASSVRLSADHRFAVPCIWHERPIVGSHRPLEKTAIREIESGQWLNAPGSVSGVLLDSQMLPGTMDWAVLHQDDSGDWLSVVNIISGERKFRSRRSTTKYLSIDVNPQTRDLALLSDTGLVEIIDSATGQIKSSMTVPEWEFVVPSSCSSQVRYSPAGDCLVAVGGRGSEQIFVFDAESGSLRFPAIDTVSDFGSVRSIEFSGNVLAVTCNGRNGVQFRNLQNGQPCGKPCPHPGDSIGLYRTRFSNDRTRIVTSHTDGFCRQFDWQTGTQFGHVFSHADEVFDAVYLRQDRFLLTACRDGYCYLWDVKSGLLVAPRIRVGNLRIDSCAVSVQPLNNDSECLITTPQGQALILDLAQLCDSESVTVTDQLANCRVQSGRQLINGSITGLRTDEWLGEFRIALTAKVKPQWSSPSQQVESLIRIVDLETAEIGPKASGKTVEELYRKSTQLPLDDPENFKLRARVLKFLSGTPSRFPAKDLLDTERERLIANWKSSDSDGIVSRAYGGLAADAWLAGEQHHWHAGVKIDVETESKATVTPDEDGGFLVQNKGIATDQYQITISDSPDDIDSFLVEVIPDSRLPGGGSGLHETGNFFLTEARVEVESADGVWAPVEILGATADYFGAPYRTRHLFDRRGSTGWTVNKQQKHQHWLLLTLPATGNIPVGARSRLSLEFGSAFPGSNLGRFRVRAGRNPNALLIEAVRSQGRATNVTSDTLIMAQSLIAGEAKQCLDYFRELTSERKSLSELPELLASIASQETGDNTAAALYLNNALRRLGNRGRNWSSETLAQIAMISVLGTKPSENRFRIESEFAENDLKRLSEEIERRAKDVSPRLDRAKWYAARHEWRSSARDYNDAHGMLPQDSILWLSVAPNLVMANQISEFEILRQSLTTLVQSERTPERLERFLKAYCLLPIQGDSSGLPVKEMLDMIESGKGPGYMPMYGFTVAGLAAFREHDYQQAIEWSRKGREFAKSKVTDIEGQTLAVEAMSLYSMQKWSEGDAVMEQLATLIPEFPVADMTKAPWEREELDASFVAHDRLVVEILRREARRLSELRTSVTPDSSQPGKTSDGR